MTRSFATNLVIVSAALLGGCTLSPPAPTSDTMHVMRSLQSLLTADGKRVCLDARTAGPPLGVFRTMMMAPAPARSALMWFAPRPLRPAGELSGSQIFDDQIRADRVTLPTPRQSATKLPLNLQNDLNRAAAQLSLDQDTDAVGIPETVTAPLAKSRWWLRNRFNADCSPVYTVSNPIVAQNVAFVSVTAGHWGTTYAFHKRADAWSPIAQWSTWIY